MSGRKAVSALVTDLDNTLWDWFDIWYNSFRALLDALIAKTGVPEEEWLPQIKKVHETHGTAEYAFLIEELPLVHALYPNADLRDEFRDVFDAHRRARKASTRLYPGVRETLTKLKAKGVLVAAYTESLAYYTVRRIRNTNLDGLIDYIYSPPDHDPPDGLSRDQFRSMPNAYYELKHTKHEETPKGLLKPAPEILTQIVEDLGINRESAAYVGDNLIKDVSMAQQVGIADVHAKYGQTHMDERYDLLRAVTHWTGAMVEQEREITEQDVTPTHVLSDSIEQLLDLFDFQTFVRRPVKP